MFKTTSGRIKLFQTYLRSKNHPAKIRIQNLIGKYFFGNGIKLNDEEKTIFSLMPNDWITRTILINGEYEAASIQLAKKLLMNGGIFFDIGANFGLYSCILAKNKKVDVYAIEPNYMVVPALLKNIGLNELDNIKVLNVALSDHFQFVNFSLPNKNNLGTASFEVINDNPFLVMSCSLQFIFESQCIKQVELMKIDIEGNEFTILKKFPYEKYFIKNILLEFNRLSATSFQELSEFFKQKGFLLKNIRGKELLCPEDGIPENNLWLVNTN